MKIECTYCGGTEFYDGPQGGAAVNMLCANPDCRHWFNNTSFEFEDLNRIEPTKEERLTEQKNRELENNKYKEELYTEGGRAFRLGVSAISITDHLDDYNVYRIAGWLDALAKSIKD